MKKDNRFLSTLKNNLVCTIVLIIAFILFLWACKGDFIGGIVTAVMAVIVCACVAILYKEYKNAPAPKAAAAKPVAKKKSRK